MRVGLRLELGRGSVVLTLSCEQRWSRGHNTRHEAKAKDTKKNPRPRTAFPRTDLLAARGQEQEYLSPRTKDTGASVLKKKMSSKNIFR